MLDIISDEIDALNEIYDGLSYSKSEVDHSIRGSFKAEIKMDNFEEVTIKLRENSFTIKHLPTIILDFWINNDTDGLDFDINCVWLPLRCKNKLSEKLKLIARDSESILWSWFQFLELDSLNYILENTKESVEIDLNIFNEHEEKNNEELFVFLQSYDTNRINSIFNDSIIMCNSCLVPKRGSGCLKLRRCGDIFCNSCASVYFNTQIKSGDLHLRCLICGGDVDYNEIKNVLDKDSFDRWDQLVFNNYLNTSDVVKSCPRCATPSPVEDSFGICPKCHFTFCSKCNGNYHADPNCNKEKEMRILETEKEELRKLKGIMAKCPTCKEIYEKTGGCNKMHCLKCQTFFCFLCSKVLDSNNPYAHFGVLPMCYL